MGPGNSRQFDFSLCKVSVNAQHFHGKIPNRSQWLKCEITATGLGMELQAPHFHSTVGMMLRSN